LYTCQCCMHLCIQLSPTVPILSSFVTEKSRRWGQAVVHVVGSSKHLRQRPWTMDFLRHITMREVPIPSHITILVVEQEVVRWDRALGLETGRRTDHVTPRTSEPKTLFLTFHFTSSLSRVFLFLFYSSFLLPSLLLPSACLSPPPAAVQHYPPSSPHAVAASPTPAFAASPNEHAANTSTAPSPPPLPRHAPPRPSPSPLSFRFRLAALSTPPIPASPSLHSSLGLNTFEAP
jgi:hypothetical protein